MGLFDKKSTTTTSESGEQSAQSQIRVQGRTDSENQMLQMLQGLSGRSMGQMGDLSGLAAGEMPELSEGMLNMLQTVADEMFSRDKRAADMTFEEGLNQAGVSAAAQGQSGGSQEAMFRAIAGRERQRAVADASSRSTEFLSRQRIALPQQQAQQMLGTNSLLYQMATQPAGMALDTMLQERLANKDMTSSSKFSRRGTSETVESGGLGDLLSLGQSLMGMGGLDLGKLFGNSNAPSGGQGMSHFDSPIGPTLSGQPMGPPNAPSYYGPYQ